MASKRNNGSDPNDASSEEDFLSDSIENVGEVAVMALETEAETERLRHELHQQQQQIEKLFRLMSKQRGIGPGQSGDRPKETAAVRRFRERTKVLKQAYPNTRV